MRSSQINNWYNYPYKVTLNKVHGRDPRKVWLYNTLKNASWGTEETAALVNGNPYPIHKTVFMFQDKNNALMFQLRWSAEETT